jgi:hypothetical protein
MLTTRAIVVNGWKPNLKRMTNRRNPQSSADSPPPSRGRQRRHSRGDRRGQVGGHADQHTICAGLVGDVWVEALDQVNKAQPKAPMRKDDQRLPARRLVAALKNRHEPLRQIAALGQVGLCPSTALSELPQPGAEPSERSLRVGVHGPDSRNPGPTREGTDRTGGDPSVPTTAGGAHEVARRVHWSHGGCARRTCVRIGRHGGRKRRGRGSCCEMRPRSDAVVHVQLDITGDPNLSHRRLWLWPMSELQQRNWRSRRHRRRVWLRREGNRRQRWNCHGRQRWCWM